MQKTCYGTGARGRRAECAACQLSAWCADAYVPCQGARVELDDRTPQEPQDGGADAPGRPDGMADVAAAVSRIIDAAIAHPSRWEVAAVKMRAPDMSFSAIARECGLRSKQHAQWLLAQACADVPEVAAAMLVDRRYSPPKDYSRPTRQSRGVARARTSAARVHAMLF